MRGLLGRRVNPPREAEIVAGSAEGRDIGLSDRQLGTPSPIPGGDTHLVNHQTMRQDVAIPVPKPEHRGMMAHGVPPDKHTGHDRAVTMRGPNDTKDPRPVRFLMPHKPITPVPVTIVQTADPRPLTTSTHRRYAVPIAGTAGAAAEPIRICGRNGRRRRLLLLNEDANHHIRFAATPAALQQANSGSILPAGATSYLTLHTQDQLYAISNDANQPIINIIEETDRPDAEVV